MIVFFSNTRGIYFTTKSTADLTGSEPKRQLDLRVEKRTCPEKKKHNYKDVLVVASISYQARTRKPNPFSFVAMSEQVENFHQSFGRLCVDER